MVDGRRRRRGKGDRAEGPCIYFYEVMIMGDMIVTGLVIQLIRRGFLSVQSVLIGTKARRRARETETTAHHSHWYGSCITSYLRHFILRSDHVSLRLPLQHRISSFWQLPPATASVDSFYFSVLAPWIPTSQSTFRSLRSPTRTNPQCRWRRLLATLRMSTNLARTRAAVCTRRRTRPRYLELFHTRTFPLSWRAERHLGSRVLRVS